MKTCYVSHPVSARDNAPVFFNALETFATAQTAYQVVFPSNDNDTLAHTFSQVAAADLVITEVSSPSTGSGIELGWASALKKPIIAFHQGGAVPTQALQHITDKIFVYVTEAHILEALDQALEAA